MTPKRKAHSSTSIQPQSKRTKYDNNNGEGEGYPASQGQIDPTYGQRGAFPGLGSTTSEDDDLFYGPASDGLEYLRMVR